MGQRQRLIPRDFETKLLDGIFLLPSGNSSTSLLYAPAIDLVQPLTNTQASMILAHAGRPDELLPLIEAVTGVQLLACRSILKPKISYKPTSVALMMTTACQLRCTYCYAEAGSTPTKNISKSVALAAVDFIVDNAIELNRKSFTIHFHGAGEPTLLWRLILEILEYGQKKAIANDLQLRTVLTTNLCVDPSLATRLANEIDVLLVSCDGTPDVMSNNRPMLRGHSGEVIDAAMRAVIAAGHRDKLLVRGTITRDTQSRLSEFVDYFADVGVRHLYLVPVSDSGRGATHDSVDAEVFVEHWMEARLRAAFAGIDLDSPVIDLDRLKPSGFACGISGANFALMPDGRISLCYEAVIPGTPQDRFFRIGSTNPATRSFEVDLARVDAVRNEFHVSKRLACNGCFAKLSCGGKCAARELGPDDAAPRDAAMSAGCDITRTLTLAAINRRLEEAEM